MANHDNERWSPYASVYDPIRVGNIDGSDTVVHDKAVLRASNVVYRPNPKLKNDPKATLFVGRLDLEVTEEDLEKVFSKHGALKSVTVVRDIVTGFSRRYAFVEFVDAHNCRRARREEHRTVLKGREILVDFECQHTLPGWVPRRLGGGFGGRKESGQLRFGCVDRPWKKPVEMHQNSRPQRRKRTPSPSEERAGPSRHREDRQDRDRSHYPGSYKEKRRDRDRTRERTRRTR